jgi:ankyrin repeat protein
VNASESTDIAHIFRKQRRHSLNLDEVMPECFRIHVSLGSQMESILSKHSSTIQLAETGLFLVANSLSDGSSLVNWVKHILGTESDSFFKQLFKLPSSTVHSFTCRLLESLSGYWGDIDRVWQLLEGCSLHRTIIAGPTGGRCLQLAISRGINWLALVLIKNGAPRNPKLGSKEPFNHTPVDLARSRELQDVLDALLGESSSDPKPAGPHSVRRLQEKERTEGEIALEKAINSKDIQQIHALLIDGLDIDSARNYRNELILEWTFFQAPEYYDIIMLYSQAPDHSWTVPGVISAAISSEELEDYLDARTGKVNGEFEGEEEDDEYEMEQYDVLGCAIELAISHYMTHEVQNILSLEWIRDGLNLDAHLLNAATSWNLDLMIELVAYGADCTILEEDSNYMEQYLASYLLCGLHTEDLQMFSKFRLFPLEDIFALNLELPCNGGEYSVKVKNVQILIDHGFDLDSTIYSKTYDSHYTPLQWAARWHSVEIARCLADAGADINGSSEYSPYTALEEAAQRGNLEMIRFLIERGADPKKFADNQESTLVELAVCYNDGCESIPEILKFLLESGADINGPNHRSPGTSWNTALTHAILKSQEHEVIYIAMEYGADINQIGGGKGARTPLQAAAEKGDVKIVKELLERGACVNAPAAPDHGRTALQAACESAKRSEEIILLLIDNGADVSALPAPRYGRTALQALCCSENPSSELVALLINRGADINALAADLEGLTALQGAALMGNLRIAILLVENDAIINAPPSRKEGRMALDGAAEYGRLDTVQFLLTFGAKCMEPGRSGYDSAIKFAEDNGHFAIADVLRGCSTL